VVTNNVVLIGRLTHEPELDYTAGQGHAVGNFSLAVDRDFTNKDDERETDFVPVRVWRRQAENVAEYLTKGSLVAVVGRIEAQSYDDREGNRRKAIRVVADKVQFLDNRKNRDNEPDF